MGPHILIVDDEAPVRHLLSDFFRRRGYLATAVKSPLEAWHALDSAPIQLVILDIALDEADGLAMLGELRQSHPRLPVLMLTGMGYDDELENEALKKGAVGYVSKMSPLDQLLMAARRALHAPVREPGGRPSS